MRHQEVGFRHHLELPESCLGQTTSCETQALALMHQLMIPGRQYTKLPK